MHRLLLMSVVGTAVLCIVRAQQLDNSTGELALPNPKDCANRIRHAQFDGHNYFFSWEYDLTKDLKVDWITGRNICRRHCMDLVSLETREENEFVKQRMINGLIRFFWTSGRKCNFEGCDREDLQPPLVNGWFWAGSGVRLGSRNDKVTGDWSKTGGAGDPQPDNREFEVEGEKDEACIAMLNNFYADGAVWHDIACYHKKWFVCEDSDTLMDFAKKTSPRFAHRI